ncbi:hypothetical protein ALC57_18503, partial [Trachymyrmex cornetzi]
LTKFMKREREGGESVDGKMEEVFRSSKKTERSPVKRGEEGEMKEIFKEMRVEMREGLKIMSKEIREVAEGQKEWMRKEMEKVKEELRVKEEKWQREKGEMLERLKALEGELGKIRVVTGESKEEGGKEREGGKVERREGKEIWIERRLERRSWKGGKEKGKNKGKEGRGVNGEVWDEEGRMAFRERLGVVEWREGRGRRLGVERRTPGYLVREELQREKLRAKAGKRAWAFEERLRRGGGSRLARLCWEEAMGNLGKGEKLEGWEREREQYFVERGVEVDRGKRGVERERRVARFRLGNEMKEGRYWEEEEERKCRLCGSEWETWEHMVYGRDVGLGKWGKEGAGKKWWEGYWGKKGRGRDG